MAASLAIQSAYLSTSSFPVVVLTECDVLSDLERTQIVEQIEQLIDDRERHVLIVDLTLGSALPDSQRIYLADTFAVRKESVAAKWAGLAIVVGEPVPSNASKAVGWQKLAPVPTEIFPTIEAATSWAENLINPGRATTSPSPIPSEALRPTRPRPVMTGMPERTSRQSGALDLSQTGPRTSISEYLKPTDKETQKAAAPGKSKAMDLKTWLKGPRGVGAGVAVLLIALFLLLAPPPDGGLSSAEARSFEDTKSKLALHVKKQRDGRGSPLTSGDACDPGDKLRFEIDVPAKGYVMLLGKRSDGSVQGVGPHAGQAQGGLVAAGSGMALPGTYDLDPSATKESFYLVGCPQPFGPGDCSSSGAGLSCPPACGVAEFVVNKKP